MTEAEKQEYLAYLQKEHGMKPDEASEYFNYAQSGLPGNKLGQQLASQTPEQNLMTTLKAGARVADMPAQGLRSILAKALGVSKPDDIQVNPDTASILKRTDIINNIKGSAQSLGIPLENAGAERIVNAVGNVGDIALDPAMLIPGAALEKLGAKSLLAKGLSKGGEAIEKGGKSLYQSAKNLQAVDKVASEYSKIAPSEVLFKHGITGSNEKMADESAKLIKKLADQRDAILEQATEAGAKVDTKAATGKARELMGEYANPNTPERLKAAQNFEEEVAQLENLGNDIDPVTLENRGTGVSPIEMAKNNSDIYGKINSQDYKKIASPELKTKLMKALARGNKEAITESVAKSLGPEAAKTLDVLNDEMSSLLTVNKKMASQGNKTVNSGLLTSVDTALIGANPGVAAAKKAGDVLKSSSFRTNAGMGLNKLGKAIKIEPKSAWLDIMALEAAKNNLGQNQGVENEKR